MKITKPDDFYIKTNLLENRYVTDGVIWTVDETIFNSETRLFLVVSLNTRAILGYIQGNNCRNDDLVIELYKEILDEYEFPSKPCFVHSDMEETYHSENVQKFLSNKGIYISTTEGAKNQNQLSESINNRIKYLVAQILLDNTNSKDYREFYKKLPDKLRSIRKKVHRCQDKEYRKNLFESKLFKNQRREVIQRAILEYNKTDFTKGISRQEAQYYDSFIEGRTIDNTQLVKKKDMIAQKIQDENVASIQFVQSKVSDILKSNTQSEQKVVELVSFMCQRQDKTDELLKQGFVGLSIQNAELLKNNQELKDDNQELKDRLDENLKKLNELLQQQVFAEERRGKRKNRKRLPAKDPVTEEIYEYLITRADSVYRETYQGARLRLTLALLVITGVRISEVLPLKINQLENLFKYSWIAIDRMKRGPSSHKAFLTQKGRKILQKRGRDFEIILYAKENDSNIFTPQYSEDPLNRTAFTKMINKFLKESVEELPNKPNIRSHSFRVGFITQLWRDTEDIEFVRQAIGHAKIDTTSRYVQNLSEEERQRRMIDIQTTDDLFY